MRIIRVWSPLEDLRTEPMFVITVGREFLNCPSGIRVRSRVVHVEEETDQRGTTGVGAFVERFEPLRERRDWAN